MITVGKMMSITMRAALFGSALSALLFALPSADGVAAPKGDDDPGKLLYNNSCRTCHSVGAGDNRLGPNLANIVGREAGAAEGYTYSSALKSAEFEWTPEKLDAFIANPDAVVPGHNMKPYTGIADAGQRKELIDYLKNPG